MKEYSWSVIIFGLVILAGIILGVWSLLWLLYCYVAQAFWPGHSVLSDPSYWQFVGAWTLLVIVASVFRGGKKSE